jgi:hypothetical protein
MLRHEDKITWLTLYAAAAHEGERVVSSWEQSRRFFFITNGKVIEALGRSREHSSQICDVDFRLLAASVVHSLFASKWSILCAFINAHTLAYLLEQCRSLQTSILVDLSQDEDLFCVNPREPPYGQPCPRTPHG